MPPHLGLTLSVYTDTTSQLMDLFIAPRTLQVILEQMKFSLKILLATQFYLVSVSMANSLGTMHVELAFLAWIMNTSIGHSSSKRKISVYFNNTMTPHKNIVPWPSRKSMPTCYTGPPSPPPNSNASQGHPMANHPWTLSLGILILVVVPSSPCCTHTIPQLQLNTKLMSHSSHHSTTIRWRCGLLLPPSMLEDGLVWPSTCYVIHLALANYTKLSFFALVRCWHWPKYLEMWQNYPTLHLKWSLFLAHCKQKPLEVTMVRVMSCFNDTYLCIPGPDNQLAIHILQLNLRILLDSTPFEAPWFRCYHHPKWGHIHNHLPTSRSS